MTEQAGHLPRVFVAGVGPLPPESPGRLFAPGLRVWGIARQLARAGHPVRLARVHFTGQPIDRIRIGSASAEGGSVSLADDREIETNEEGLAAALEAEAARFGAEAVIGSTDLINRELGRMKGELPLWCDYFGDPMAERQMLAQLHQSDGGLADQWRTLVPALRRADRLSGCSDHQVGAILGELASVGRLNQFTAAEKLVVKIPPWIEPIEPSTEAGPFLRGPIAPEDARIVIQTGGFNTWMDIETLFAALELAMGRDPKLHFATTGGSIAGHNEKSFEKFKASAEGSKFADRYHFLGWLPLGRVPRVIAEADLAVNVDRPCPEGWLGTRNRPMDWLAAEKPVVSTVGCELVRELADREFIFGVAQADADAVAAGIERILADLDRARAMAKAGREYLIEHHSPARCLAPLLDWARSPVRASDLQAWEGGSARPPTLWSEAIDRSEALEGSEKARSSLDALSAEVRTLKGSRLVRAALWLRQRLGRR